MARERLPHVRRLGWMAGALLALASLSMLLLSVAVAQETPDGETPTATAGTPEATPAPGGTQIRLEAVALEQPVPDGDEFEIRVLVDNVEHLASFDVQVSFDEDLVEPVGAEQGTPAPTPENIDGLAAVTNIGAILETSARGPSMNCEAPAPFYRSGSVTFTCATFDLPVCAGGPVGAEGSGELGTIRFRVDGDGGTASFSIVRSTLVLDDIVPCDSETGDSVPIEHARGGPVTVEVEGGSGGTSAVLIIVIIVVVAVVVVAGGGGYFWYRRRAAA